MGKKAEAVVLEAAASGEALKVGMVRVVGGMFAALKWGKALKSTVTGRVIEQGDVILFGTARPEWIEAIKVSGVSGSPALKDSWRGYFTMHGDDIHKGSVNMLKRTHGSRYLEIGGLEAMDETAKAIIVEFIKQAGKASKAKDMAKEFKGVANERTRAAMIALDSHPDVAKFKVSSKDYDPDSDWPFSPDADVHNLTFEDMIKWLKPFVKDDDVLKELDTDASAHKAVCERWIKKHPSAPDASPRPAKATSSRKPVIRDSTPDPVEASDDQLVPDTDPNESQGDDDSQEDESTARPFKKPKLKALVETANGRGSSSGRISSSGRGGGVAKAKNGRS